MTARFVTVNIESSHIDADENLDTIKSFVIGKIIYHNDNVYISYEEPDENGMEGTKTILKLAGDKITLSRSGDVRQNLNFEKGKITRSLYQTPFGALAMSVETRILQVIFAETDIDIYIEYILMINEKMQGLTRLRIGVREDSKVGH